MAPSSHTRPIVSVMAQRDATSAWIRLVGDIDMTAKPALVGAADRLAALPLRFIVIDLTAVTFVCSTLANFLDLLHRAHPDADLVLRHPSALARILVAVTGMESFVTMSDRPASTATVPSENGLSDAGNAARSQPDRWEAVNRQPGRAQDFSTTGTFVDVPEQTGARDTNRRRRTILRWIATAGRARGLGNPARRRT